MKKRNIILVIAAILLVSFSNAAAQGSRNRITAGTGNLCQLTGAYRIDVEESDKLYSVVKGATSSVPFVEQQRFFTDLSVRLTPPDMLAIECRGGLVSIASSRAPKVTFFADGKTRRERRPGGKIVLSRVELNKDTLTFTSSGEAEDNINVAFKSVDDGRRLRVIRRIHAEQLVEPIIIQTVYNKVAEMVRWDTFGEGQIARQAGSEDAGTIQRGNNRPDRAGGNVAALRNALNDWIDATNQRDIDRQMSFYMSEMKAFYLSRNVTRNAVQREKSRIFSKARSVDIRAEEPEIIFQNADRTAVMRFRKKYRVVDNTKIRSGEVIQELRWQQTNGGWRIFSERDVKVIR
ncbi:hypothetical protein BH18ACI3_BH18ACI3_12060 [soil metagenome]